MNLAAQYAAASEQIEVILARKPVIWQTLRERANSDTGAERAWQGTDDGITELKLRLKMKRIEKQMSAAKTMLDVLAGESRNNY